MLAENHLFFPTEPLGNARFACASPAKTGNFCFRFLVLRNPDGSEKKIVSFKWQVGAVMKMIRHGRRPERDIIHETKKFLTTQRDFSAILPLDNSPVTDTKVFRNLLLGEAKSLPMRFELFRRHN